MRCFLLTYLLLTVWNFINSQEIEQPGPLTNARLPTNIYPLDYYLAIKTYLPGYSWEADSKNTTFEGTVIITVEVKEATDRIILNSDSLEIISTYVISDSGHVNITGIETIRGDQLLILQLNQEISPEDNIEISISFKGHLRNDLKGFYITRSQRSNGEKMINAVTQFEPAAARFMVPCFDEPEFKATWQVILEYPTGSVALTNTIEEETMASGAFTLTKYKKTVKMSSYLLAIFIGDVQFKEITTDKGLRIRVYADPDNIDYVDYALNVSRQVVEGFEKLFKIDFPMEKIDFVSVHDFSAGAMENWGLIVHSSTAILGMSSWIADVVIHELAHQWFGNLITMKYWDQVWLNEGFASYMESYGKSFIDSNFDEDSFHLKKQTTAKKMDRSIPLNTVSHGKDGSIDIAPLNYPKGTSLIRMFEKIIGAENFITALRNYLFENKYSNVEDKDLYKSIEAFNKPLIGEPENHRLDIESFARCWTHQNGYPTVYVEDSDEGVILTQRRDLTIESGYKNFDECGYKWDIPIWYQEPGQTNIELIWLKKEKYELELKVQDAVIINANSNGYYDVVYSDRQYTLIAIQLHNNTQLYSVNTKFRLLNDVSNYALAGKTSLHNSVVIAKSLLSDEDKFIRLLAQKVLDDVQPRLLSVIGLANLDLQSIENRRPSELTERSTFSDCSKTENFSSCFKKTFKSETEACMFIALEKSNTVTRRLTSWLKTDKTAESRQAIIRLLSCEDEETYRKTISDESFNWSRLEKQLNSLYLQRFEHQKKQSSKSQRLFETDLFHSSPLLTFIF